MKDHALKPFLKYIGRKFLFLLITYFIAITIVFILPRAIPGNPLSTLLRQIFQQGQANPELIRSVHKTLMEEFGLGKPWYQQYTDFILRAFKGDLGTSISSYPKKTLDLIVPVIPWTLMLLIPSIITAWIIGNTLGAVAGFKRGSFTDKFTLNFSLIVSQIPYYWLGMLLIFTLSVKLHIFPGQGGYSQGTIPTFTLKFILDMLYHYILPFLSIVISALGGWAIGTRVLVIYELDADYVNFGELLGLKEKTVFRYIFRNSILPQVTGLALSLGGALGGALITEIIFNYPELDIYCSGL